MWINFNESKGMWQRLQAVLSRPVPGFLLQIGTQQWWTGITDRDRGNACRAGSERSFLFIVDFLIAVSFLFSSLPDEVVPGLISISLLLIALPSVQIVMCVFSSFSLARCWFLVLAFTEPLLTPSSLSFYHSCLTYSGSEVAKGSLWVRVPASHY